MNPINLRLVVLAFSVGLISPLLAGNELAPGATTASQVGSQSSGQGALLPGGNSYGSDRENNGSALLAPGSRNQTKEKVVQVEAHPRPINSSGTSDPKFQGSLLDVGLKSLGDTKTTDQKATAVVPATKTSTQVKADEGAHKKQKATAKGADEKKSDSKTATDVSKADH